MKQKLVDILTFVSMLVLVGCSLGTKTEEIVQNSSNSMEKPIIQTIDTTIENKSIYTVDDYETVVNEYSYKDIDYYKNNCMNKLKVNNDSFVYRVAYEDGSKDLYLCFIRDKIALLFSHVNDGFMAATPEHFYISGTEGLIAFPIEDIGIVSDFMNLLYTDEFFDDVNYVVQDIDEVKVYDSNPNYMCVTTKTTQGKSDALFTTTWLLNIETDEVDSCQTGFISNNTKGFEYFYSPQSEFLNYDLDKTDEELQALTTERYAGVNAKIEIAKHLDFINSLVDF